VSAVIGSDAQTLAAVQKAWMQALEIERCDFTQSWEEAGGNSLATLHLLLLVERALGCKLTFDMVRPETHAGDLVALLRLGPPALAATPRLVHLVPGLFGDEPRLATFRQALAGRISFNVVPIPDLGQPAAILGDMRRIAALTARDIQARQPAGPILLAGFSFGGCVAFETARALMAAGRQIAFLGLLDPPVGRVAAGTTRPWMRRLGPRTIGLAITRRLCCWDAGRRACLSLAKRMSLSAQIALQQYVYLAFLDHARNRWSPATLEVDTWLAVSAQFAPDTLSTWQRLCPRPLVVHVPGAHLDIFQAPAVKVLIPAFERAVRATHARLRLLTPQVHQLGTSA
jgi:thioesterase domain-containing protein